MSAPTAPATARLARHALVWPSAVGNAALLAQAGNAVARDALALWRARGLPLVVRRRDADRVAAPGSVAVGLPLPPSWGKRRLGFTLARADVARVALPIALHDIAARLPAPWRAPLARLDAEARARGVVLRGFGALAWQAISGLVYAHPASDVDILFAPSTANELESALTLFARVEAQTPLRIDAEIAFGDDAGVNWREWRAPDPADRVLVKSIGGVSLVTRAALVARLATVALAS